MEPMPPSSIAAHEADFSILDHRARNWAALNIVFLGGSLTWGAQATDPQVTSYRGRISEKFIAEYPKAHFTLWDAAIGGTGSQLAAFRLDRDVFSRKPDIVFLDFTINDDPYPSPDPGRLASYEAVVRRLVEAKIPIVQLIFPAKQDMLPEPPDRPLDKLHKEIALAYRLPSADVVKFVRAKIRAGQTTPNLLWDNPCDVTHPGDNGYALYAEAAWETFTQAVRSSTVCQVPEKMLHADTYMTVNRWLISSAKTLPIGWSLAAPSRNAIAYDFIPSRWMGFLAIATYNKESNQKPSPLCLKIRGQDVFVFGEANPRIGKYQVRIDGANPKEFDGGAMARNGDMRYIEMIAQDLDPNQEHIVEFIPQLQPGQELRFESVCVAGAPATASII